MQAQIPIVCMSLRFVYKYNQTLHILWTQPVEYNRILIKLILCQTIETRRIYLRQKYYKNNDGVLDLQTFCLYHTSQSLTLYL